MFFFFSGSLTFYLQYGTLFTHVTRGGRAVESRTYTQLMAIGKGCITIKNGRGCWEDSAPGCIVPSLTRAALAGLLHIPAVCA